MVYGVMPDLASLEASFWSAGSGFQNVEIHVKKESGVQSLFIAFPQL